MQIQRRHIINGGFLVGAVAGANFLNFIFNAVLGRWLSFEDFGLVTLIITFYSISAIFTNSLAGVVNFSISKLASRGETEHQYDFLKNTMTKATLYLVIAVGVWSLGIPILKNIFHVPSSLPFLAFIPVLIFSVYSYAIVGYFQGRLEFLFAGILILSEAFFKLLAGLFFPLTNSGVYSYLSIPISLLVTMSLAFILLQKKNQPVPRKTALTFTFPSRYYLTAIAVGLGSTLFFSVDILTVRHFFSTEISGQYALVSLIGKMVFFLSILPNMFTLPLVARTTDKKRINKIFMILIASTATLALGAWVVLGAFGGLIVPLLFGDKSLAILHLLPLYTLGVGLYVLSSVIVSFHLAQQQYSFSYPLITAGLVVGVLIFLRHQDLEQITTNITFTCAVLLAFLIGMHMVDKRKELVNV